MSTSPTSPRPLISDRSRRPAAGRRHAHRASAITALPGAAIEALTEEFARSARAGALTMTAARALAGDPVFDRMPLLLE